ncbi:MAG: ribosomal-protein-alanine N-acetyltransferase, partial [Saprospiraceae bacterium]
MAKNNFETERLILRKLRKEDVDLIYELNADPEVMKYFGEPDSSYENAKKYVDMRVHGYADKDGLGIFVANIKNTGKPIGWFCLKYIDGTEEVEIGFRLLKKYWDQGLATEGATCLVNFGFKELGLNEIVGVSKPENKASQQVLKKVGLAYVGIARYYDLDLSYFKKSAIS